MTTGRSRRAAQKQATQAAVIAAAREEFEAVGYEAASIRAIARRAGVSAGTVIHDGADKRDRLVQETNETDGTDGDEEEAMTSLFKSDDARVTLLRWFKRFRGQLTVPPESRTVTTRFGETHVLIGGPAGAPALVVLHGDVSIEPVARWLVSRAGTTLR